VPIVLNHGEIIDHADFATWSIKAVALPSDDVFLDRGRGEDLKAHRQFESPCSAPATSQCELPVSFRYPQRLGWLRAGTVASSLVLGGRRVNVRRPRVRSVDGGDGRPNI
jgi:hypothetical protein